MLRHPRLAGLPSSPCWPQTVCLAFLPAPRCLPLEGSPHPHPSPVPQTDAQDCSPRLASVFNAGRLHSDKSHIWSGWQESYNVLDWPPGSVTQPSLAPRSPHGRGQGGTRGVGPTVHGDRTRNYKTVFTADPRCSCNQERKPFYQKGVSIPRAVQNPKGSDPFESPESVQQNVTGAAAGPQGPRGTPSSRSSQAPWGQWEWAALQTPDPTGGPQAGAFSPALRRYCLWCRLGLSRGETRDQMRPRLEAVTGVYGPARAGRPDAVPAVPGTHHSVARKTTEAQL